MLDTARLGMPRLEVDRGRGGRGHAREVERHGQANEAVREAGTTNLQGGGD
jgi:hypothetical protein